ncbi:Hypothetical predicted protein [Mytilus galloprovincialis]|uniref:Uncharacterized protein n=1 Tax=Mytilus galloprovincialis TaxID=29158 RepID=A0A8B6EX11_MYTGA|nr:Hypothetical predicted protein [Mytilus galloprovincialis]
MVCPIETTRDITWTGPPKYTLYAVGTDVYSHVSTLVEIKKTDTDKKSVLIIHRFTDDISGEFRCGDGVNVTEFTLVIKRDPSDIAIEDATGQKITTVEGREHTLECSVTSGQPGGNITWSTDGAVVEINQSSSVRYRLIPQRPDNGKLFKCEAFNSEGKKVLESSVQLEVFYIPRITFRPNQTLTVKEGEDTQLMCRNDGNDPDATTVWKRLHKNTIIIQNDELNFKSINRTDAGIYTCRVDTKAGVYEDNATVVVQYAPTIDIQYSPNERQMKCIPNGLPDRYMFKNWEHTTEYNDHIRFLPTRKDGNTATLTFPTNVTEKNHHEDRGTPYFVSSTENTQYGVYLKTAKIEIKFVSVPEYTSYEVLKNGSRFTNFTEFDYRNTNVTDNIYGKNVSVKGSILSLQIQIDTPEYFTSYEIVVKNVFGSSNHAIKLVSASAPFTPKIVRTDAKQTQIYVLWAPRFDGGYPQWFIIEYKEMGDIYWNNQTINASNSTFIGGLQPATNYLIQMFARNMIDDSNRTEEISVQTDKRVSETNLSAIVSLLAVFLCLLIAVAYFRRANSRAIGNDLDALQNGIHTNSDIAEIPVYSSIDKRHNLRLHQTGAYTVDHKGITNPLKSGHQNRETGKEVNRASKFGSMKCSSGIEENEKESRELNYVEIFFDQKQVYPFTIHGLDDKTNYVEIDFTQSADPLPDSDTDSESEK